MVNGHRGVWYSVVSLWWINLGNDFSLLICVFLSSLLTSLMFILLVNVYCIFLCSNRRQSEKVDDLKTNNYMWKKIAFNFNYGCMCNSGIC